MQPVITTVKAGTTLTLTANREPRTANRDEKGMSADSPKVAVIARKKSVIKLAKPLKWLNPAFAYARGRTLRADFLYSYRRHRS